MMDWSGTFPAKRGEDPGQVTITPPTQAALMDDLRHRFRARTGFAVATLNLDHVVKLRGSEVFRNAYINHSHVVADGNPIVWLSRLAGQHVDLVPGSDLTVPVAMLAAEENIPVAFLGSTAETLAAAETRLHSDAPNLNIVARIAPAFGFDPTGPAADACLEELRSSGARLCFVALGAPKQELFAAHAQAALPETGFLSIGASLDFLSGAQTRAPLLVRRLALEWVWRLGTNPRRLAARYGACIAILPSLLIRALRIRFSNKTTPGGPA